MHAHAWVAWVALVMAVALTMTNPYYLGVVLLCLILVAIVAPRTARAVAGLRVLAIFGLTLIGLSMLIAIINGNYGTHILFTIPSPSLPGWLGGLRLGGPVTAEGLVAAAIRGLAIFCVLLAFGIFNGAVSPHRVLRSAPAALFQAGLVVTIGLTLLPSSIEDVRRIREMRALRGARTGFRDLPGLIVPSVIGGLERSMRLAEAMEARGYGAGEPLPLAGRLLGAASAPLMLGAVATWSFAPKYRPLALAAGVFGALALLLWGWLAARARHTTRLDSDPISVLDRSLAMLSVALAVVAVVGVGWLQTGYDPFSGLRPPAFALPGALLAVATAWPALRLLAVPATNSEVPAPSEMESARGELPNEAIKT